jgi:putative membrane protein
MPPNYLSGLPHFFQYFAMAALLLTLFWSLYTFFTPHDEMALIKQGNVTAAVVLVGALIGFAIPVAAAIMQSVSAMALAQWGVVAIGVQILVYTILRLFFRTLSDDLSADRLSMGILVAGISVVSGILNAAAMSYT